MMLTKEILDKVLSSLQIEQGAKLVLAISGGVDSVVLAHLLTSLNYRVHFAHVNYGLRVEQSNTDEQFVVKLAKKLGAKSHVLRVDSELVFGKEKHGVQALARDIRYTWLEELRVKLKAKAIVVAHHRNDQAETLVHKFVRGGGLKSLTPMRPIRDSIVRPLLGFSKKEIEEFASSNSIEWRHDQSNDENHYTRNRIRNEIIPILKAINPNLEHVLIERSNIVARFEQYANDRMRIDLEQICTDSSALTLSLSALKKHGFADLLLLHWLETKGISPTALPEVLKLMNAHAGSQMVFENWLLWKDNDALVLQQKRDVQAPQSIAVESPCMVAEFPGLSFSLVDSDQVDFRRTNHKIFIDEAKIVWPMEIRSWQIGDRFVPLGMEHEQKLSDFFTHNKIPVRERSKYPVILSSGKIIAIAGLRPAESVRITDETQRFLKIEFIP
jgi:tRNA(Ile)-lysidine synthase